MNALPPETGVAPPEAVSGIETPMPVPFESLPETLLLNSSVNGLLETITGAARNFHTISISYADKGGTPTTREIEPYEIRGQHLWAFCLLRQQTRRFLIYSISSAVETPNIFSPRWPILI